MLDKSTIATRANQKTGSLDDDDEAFLSRRDGSGMVRFWFQKKKTKKEEWKDGLAWWLSTARDRASERERENWWRVSVEFLELGMSSHSLSVLLSKFQGSQGPSATNVRNPEPPQQPRRCFTTHSTMSSSSLNRDPPSTPPSASASASASAGASKNPPPSSTTRRSARVHKRDPIVAPGFGTLQDLQQLATCLDQPLDVVQAIMSAQGRGIRRRGKQQQASAAAETTTTTPVMNAAWANFLSEEQPSSSNTDTTTKDSSDTTTTTTKRTYQLPLAAAPSFGPPPKKKSKPSKHASNAAAERGGILVQSGTLDASCIGRTRPSLERSFDLSRPSRLFAMPTQIQVRRVASSCTAAHALALDVHGRVYGWGRNEHQQLTHANQQTNVGRPFLLETSASNGTPIVQAAVGKAHSLLLDQHGQIHAVGSNKVGQCGINSWTEAISNFRKAPLDESITMVQISCGDSLSVALDTEGRLYTTGSSEYGQLGNGETGEYFVAANKLAFANANAFTLRSSFCHAPTETKLYTSGHADVPVVPIEDEDIRLGHIACGKYHTVAVEAPAAGTAGGSQLPPRVFTWGCGNYGCLGHGRQADEYKPRLVASLSSGGSHWKTNPCVSAAAGASCSMVLTQAGHVYYWGKHRSVGEAVMRPTLLAELANNGHVAQHVAAGNQTVVISTQNAVTVAWGQGPHGELGLETKKSSSKPVFVPALDKCRILDLACGYGTTYYIVKNEDKDDEAAIEQLPTVSDEVYVELEQYAETVAESKKK